MMDFGAMMESYKELGRKKNNLIEDLPLSKIKRFSNASGRCCGVLLYLIFLVDFSFMVQTVL